MYCSTKPLHEHKWSWPRFGWGVVGAAAPEIYRIVRTSDVSLKNADHFLIVMSILYLFIGGAFAVAWEDNWPLKSIYVGSTFPIWISTWTHIIH